MPIIPLPDGRMVLRCVNHQLSTHRLVAGSDTTMRAEDGWLSLIAVFPKGQPGGQPTPPGFPFDWTTHPRLNLQRGQAVRSYTCSACGYVELYDATTLDPETWGTKIPEPPPVLTRRG